MTDTQQSATHPQPEQYPPQQSSSQPPAAPVQGKPARNVLGIIALVVAALGFIFACVPGALIVGWILLPIAFVLGIVAVCLKGKVKWQGITAIIVSVVGTIVGFIVFFAVVAASFANAFGGTDTQVSTGEDTAVVEEGTPEEPAEEPAAEVGTRENPAPLGSTIEGSEWTVVINSVTLNATDEVVAANMVNEAPDAGSEYIVINYTATYTGDDADGAIPAMVGIEYVTAAGVTVDPLEKFVVAPDEVDTLSTLYAGASVTGNTAIQVPSPADGVIAVRPGLIADKVFVAIQ